MVCTSQALARRARNRRASLSSNSLKSTKTRMDCLSGRNVKDASDDLNVSIPLVKDIFIQATNQGLHNVSLKSADRSAAKSDKQCINTKGSFILPKDTIAELNKNLEEERKFKIGDKFTAIQSAEGERIILDRVPCELLRNRMHLAKRPKRHPINPKTQWRGSLCDASRATHKEPMTSHIKSIPGSPADRPLPRGSECDDGAAAVRRATSNPSMKTAPAIRFGRSPATKTVTCSSRTWATRTRPWIMATPTSNF